MKSNIKQFSILVRLTQDKTLAVKSAFRHANQLVIAFIFLISSLGVSFEAEAQVECGVIQTLYQTRGDGSITEVWRYNPFLETYVVIDTLEGASSNASTNSAYNANSALVYAADGGGKTVKVFDPDNSYSYVGNVNFPTATGNTSNKMFSQGDSIGYIAKVGSTNYINLIDVAGIGSYPANRAATTITISGTYQNCADFVLIGNHIYGAIISGTDFVVTKINVSTGVSETFDLNVAYYPSVTPDVPTGGFGACWQDRFGTFYAFNNNTGGIFRVQDVVNVSDGDVATMIFEADGSGSNDGFGCEILSNPIDWDGDGVDDFIDRDIDNDGILNLDEYFGNDPEADVDGDDVTALSDDDDNNASIGNDDGIIGFVFDVDGDGIPNAYDLDSDGDGIVDNIEAQGTSAYTASSNLDDDNDGLDNAYEGSGNEGLAVVNTDAPFTISDGIPDFVDPDSDNDGFSDALEAYDTDGDYAANVMPSGQDSDFDGIDDNYDLQGNGHADPDAASNDSQLATDFPDQQAPGGDRDWRDPSNFDGDALVDDLDADDDNDGITDINEYNPALDPFGDEDGDGVPNFTDTDDNGTGDGSSTDYTDSNNDGIPDVYDTDLDGIFNHLDLDSDGDNCPDALEGSEGFALTDIDGDLMLTGTVDGNGIPTAANGGQTPDETYNNLLYSDNCDNDGDGFLNGTDECDDTVGIAPTGCPDTDNDGLAGSDDPDDADPCNPNPLAIDAGDCDGDGITNVNDECPTVAGIAPTGCPDGDSDGVAGTDDPDDADPCNPDPLAIDAGDCDSDGVPNVDDECPTVAGIAPTGCPDGDSDGVAGTDDPDDADPCNPNPLAIAGGDCDSDGVTNENDFCPTEAGTLASGCPNQCTAGAIVGTVTANDPDADGINNICDLDDDNDGILDTEEGCTSSFSWSTAPVVVGNTATGIINGVNYTYTSSEPVLTTTYMYSHATFPASYNVPNLNPTIKNEQTTNNTLDFDSPVLNPVFVFSSIGNPSNSVPIQFSSPVEILFGQAVVQDSPTQITGTEGYAIVRMNGAFNSISFNYTEAETYVNFAFGSSVVSCAGDADDDGLLNFRDIDSDNDGCTDATEAGHIDANNDGQVDGTGFSSNGQVTGAATAYTGSNANVTSAIQFSVSTAPSNQTVNTGDAASFGVTATADIATSYLAGTPTYGTPGNANGGINYQWYLGTPGSGGTPISNGGIYSGADAATLNISDATGLDGTQYCVLISHDNRACVNEIACAALTVGLTATANDDDFSGTPINPVTGGTTTSVFNDNGSGVDEANGAAATDANIDDNISISNDGGLTGVTINSDGTINIPANATPNTYSVEYTICLTADNLICNSGTITIVIGDCIDFGVNDCDSDGVINSNDECPTVAGIAPTGCPDGDSDGVAGTDDPDDADPCNPDPLAIDAGDCDSDGVPNIDDECPTVAGIAPTGCPDGDSDGVAGSDDPDDADPCNPDPLAIDAGDCDSDGVPNIDDECPTVAGIAPTGCPDGDSDGVAGSDDPDDADPCNPDPLAIDAGDCDSDGVPNVDDECPTVAGIAPTGCPDGDSDGVAGSDDPDDADPCNPDPLAVDAGDCDSDGVPNVDDECPTVAGIAPTGCPDGDSDGVAGSDDPDDADPCNPDPLAIDAGDCDSDGIPNVDDECPTVAGIAPTGCPDGDSDGVAGSDDPDDADPCNPDPLAIDAGDCDSDGVPNIDDECPTVAGIAPTGCPDGDSDGVAGSDDPDDADPCNPDPLAIDAGDCDSDGIPNVDDECPTVAGIAPTGCPDGDSDGVAGSDDPDDADPCNPDPLAVDAGDCDSDGIPNVDDECPTVAGIAPTGCPDGDSDGVAGTDDPDDADPCNPDPLAIDAGDCDGDGVTNATETADGTDAQDPCSFILANAILAPDAAWNDADCDGDGITNAQEVIDGTDPLDNCSLIFINATVAPDAAWNDADCDGDGVTNGQEVIDGTDPTDDCSTDLNSISVAVTSTSDCDGDGVTNDVEAIDGTNSQDPCSFILANATAAPDAAWTDADCDGDGVTNGQEVSDSTDPLNNCDFVFENQTATPDANWEAADCDEDGVSNGDEIADGTHPMNDCDFLTASITLPVTSTPDCDGDGVSNPQEILDGTDPDDLCDFDLANQTQAPSAEWNDADCDGDGVTNADELVDGTDPLDDCAFVSKSISTTVVSTNDCDRDGVTNSDESTDGTDSQDPCSFILASATVAPDAAWNDADCDGDGVTNGQEIIDGTDSQDPCSFDLNNASVEPSTAWNDADCDGDGVTNGTEIIDGTDPQDVCAFDAANITLPITVWEAADCDGDGVTNGEEIDNGTDPFDTCDFDYLNQTEEPSAIWEALDCDADGVSNGQEVIDGTDTDEPCDYLAASQDADLVSEEWNQLDCDGDGVSNGDEVENTTDPQDPCAYLASSQNIALANNAWDLLDCDGDGVNNGTEVADGTDANDPCEYLATSQDTESVSSTWEALDCDGDGVSNGQELIDGTDQNDPCSSEDYSVTLPITSTSGCALFVPEGFSPNGDGVNDVLVITGLDNYPDHTFTIFNRWGNKVFDANPYNNDWAGKNHFGVTIGDDELPVGTYFYIIELGGGLDPVKGYIYLNR